MILLSLLYKSKTNKSDDYLLLIKVAQSYKNNEEDLQQCATAKNYKVNYCIGYGSDFISLPFLIAAHSI